MKEVNLVMVKVKIKHLKPGTVFNAGPVAVRVLEHFPDGKTLVITDECIADRSFTCQPFKPNRPEDWKANNWRTSTLRTDLNRDFLNSFDEAGGPILSKNIIPAEWDLTDSDGNNIYGSVTDKIGLLTEAMFRKYYVQGLLDLNDWWWLITPDADESCIVQYVNTDGTLGICDAYYGIRGVRPALFVESEIEVEVEEGEVDIPPSTLLKGFTTRQLVEELFRRIDTEKDLGFNMRRFVTDETGAVIHISSSDILTKESIECWEKETGMELRCAICGSRLQPGDQKDHFWPYFSNYNRCRKCLEKEKT